MTVATLERPVSQEPRTEVWEITPQIAAEWLPKFTKNRPTSKTAVEKYAREMTAGRWALNGEPIKFSKDDTGLDGEHRLNACIESQTSFQSFVVFDLEPVVFETLDLGRKRSAANILSMEGTTNANSVAAMGTIVWQWENETTLSSTPLNCPTTLQVVATVRRHQPAIVQWANHFRTDITRSIGRPSLVLGLTYIFSKIDRDDAVLFLQAVATGEHLDRKDIRYTLRERLVADRLAKTTLPRREAGALIIKAWNLFRVGETRVQLRWRSSGESREPFPVPE